MILNKNLRVFTIFNTLKTNYKRNKISMGIFNKDGVRLMSNISQNNESLSDCFKLNITENALKRLQGTLKDGQMLRISVTSGGCSGLRYCFSIENSTDEHDIVIDTNPAGKVVVDDISCEYINGSTLIYKEQLIKSAFSIEENPNVKLGCGCGQSFDPISLDDENKPE